jgi:hypothetical protein
MRSTTAEDGATSITALAVRAVAGMAATRVGPKPVVEAEFICKPARQRNIQKQRYTIQIGTHHKTKKQRQVKPENLIKNASQPAEVKTAK